MGSGLSTKYVLHTYHGVLEVGESEQEYRRVFDEDYLDEFCREMIERPKEDGSSIDGNYLKVQALHFDRRQPCCRYQDNKSWNGTGSEDSLLF